MNAASDDIPDLTGRWACAQVLAGHAKVPVIGAVDARTTVLSRLDIDHSGDDMRELSVRWRVVGMDVDVDSRMSRPEIQDAHVEALELLERKASLVSGDDGGWVLEMDAASSVVGADLESPDSALPDSGSDSRVEDSDRDGKPGVTIRFRGIVSGRAYVVQKTTTALVSTDLDGTDVAGRVRWSVEQNVLGASNPLLRLAPDVTPDDDDSWFRMRRVGDDASDDDVTGVAGDLLDEGPPD